jgi:hypothetical protein
VLRASTLQSWRCILEELEDPNPLIHGLGLSSGIPTTMVVGGFLIASELRMAPVLTQEPFTPKTCAARKPLRLALDLVHADSASAVARPLAAAPLLLSALV